MARARSSRAAWLLLAAAAPIAACAQILGIEPWVPRDAGAGGGGSGGAASATTTTSSSTSSGDAGDAGTCAEAQPSCQGCTACADLNGGPCEAAYVACAAANDAGGCNSVLTCLTTCGADTTCIGVCPGEETTPTKLFPPYASCLCAQCAPSCASFATALCH